MLKKLTFAMVLLMLLFVLSACGGDDDKNLEDTPAPTAQIGEMVAPTPDEDAVVDDEDAVIDVSGEIELHVPEEQINYSAAQVAGDPDYYVLTIGASDAADQTVFSIILTLRSTLEPDTYPVIFCGDDQAPPPDEICAVMIGSEGSLYRDITEGTLELTSTSPLSGTLVLSSNKIPAPTDRAGTETPGMTDLEPLGTVNVKLTFEDVEVTEE